MQLSNKKFFFSVLIASVLTGTLTAILISYTNSPKEILQIQYKIQQSDAIAIANTYIVFTTLIAAIAAVIIAFLSYLFISKLEKSQQSHHRDICNELINIIKNEEGVDRNDQIAIDLLSSLLENKVVINAFQTKVDEKLVSIFNDVSNESNARNLKAQEIKNKLSDRMKGGS